MGIDDHRPHSYFHYSHELFFAVVFHEYLNKPLINNEFGTPGIVLIIDLERLIRENPKYKNLENGVTTPYNNCYFYNIYDNCGKISYSDQLDDRCTMHIESATCKK